LAGGCEGIKVFLLLFLQKKKRLPFVPVQCFQVPGVVLSAMFGTLQLASSL
jgi:hypothetical protein